ncbi:DNA helicase [Fusarium beomiforme]|uniref:DNA helicase n=1 Tax=Fusarium beomiforme TaxID=44412 RepID=A0A9P5AJI0_9HYPO|nr:DNA helicase [Fusarium beomiforme]
MPPYPKGQLRTNQKRCAVLFGDAGPVVASSASFNLGTKIEARVATIINPSTDPLFGFELTIPRDPDQSLSEENGFGVCHAYNMTTEISLPADFVITVKFPRGNISCTYEPVPEPVQAKFPDIDDWQPYTYLAVHIHEGSFPTIKGYGKPFANPIDPELEGWVNQNMPMYGNVTLLDILQQRTFFFVIAWPLDSCTKRMGDHFLPPPFTYGYPYQPTDEDSMKKLIDENAGGTFQPCHAFDSDDAHRTAVNQSVVQDLMWVHREAELIAETRFPAYFTTPKNHDPSVTELPEVLHLVVHLPEAWKVMHDAALRRLMRDEILSVKIYDAPPGHAQAQSATWVARIIEWTSSVTELDDHPIPEHELILRVRRSESGPNLSIHHFNYVSLVFHSGIEEVIRRVNNVRSFTQYASPTNPKAWGMVLGRYARKLLYHQRNEAQKAIYHNVMFRMDVHLALLRGTGFYEVLRKWSLERRVGALPCTNFLDIGDELLTQSIVEETLPQDQARFRGYLSNRFLGIGIIASPAGFGKTTAGAAASLAMQAKLGKILCAGPTHAATDNFAQRIDQRTRAVAERYNQTMESDADRCHHRLVIQVHHPNHELMAFKRILHNPDAVDKAAEKGQFAVPSNWKLPLSLAYWLLCLLRSEVVPPLEADASPALHSRQRSIDENDRFSTLRQVATRQVDWNEYASSTPDADEDIKYLMVSLMEDADFICATPAIADLEPVLSWKTEVAQGLAVDEASNMNRADLYGLWGNTLLPCFLFGDTRQLPPTVLTINEKDIAGNHLNRFAADGATSPLAFLQGTGIPVFRLKTQLRMANGMFDLVAKTIYPDVPFQYGPRSSIDLPKNEAGRDIEAFFLAKFPDEMTPSPEGKLLPIFVHCRKGRVSIDSRTNSKTSLDQVKMELDTVTELVHATHIDASSTPDIAFTYLL